MWQFMDAKKLLKYLLGGWWSVRVLVGEKEMSGVGAWSAKERNREGSRVRTEGHAPTVLQLSLPQILHVLDAASAELLLLLSSVARPSL